MLAAQTAELCYEYVFDTYWALFLSNAMTAFVSGVNYFLAIVNQSAIETIGYDTRSENTSAILTSIAFSSFVNTGILTLLTNADLSFVPFFGSVFPFLRMQFSDIGVDWYLTIGPSLAQTMMIAAVMPWMLLCSAVCQWKVY